MSDFRLYNLEFGVSKNPVGDAQIYSCMLGVYKELIDDYDAEATAMFDYYINGDNYIEENKEELYRYINKLDDKYYVGSESYVCYEKSDEALSLYVTNVKDWDSAIIEKFIIKLLKSEMNGSMIQEVYQQYMKTILTADSLTMTIQKLQ